MRRLCFLDVCLMSRTLFLFLCKWLLLPRFSVDVQVWQWSSLFLYCAAELDKQLYRCLLREAFILGALNSNVQVGKEIHQQFLSQLLDIKSTDIHRPLIVLQASGSSEKGAVCVVKWRKHSNMLRMFSFLMPGIWGGSVDVARQTSPSLLPRETAGKRHQARLCVALFGCYRGCRNRHRLRQSFYCGATGSRHFAAACSVVRPE